MELSLNTLIWITLVYLGDGWTFEGSIMSLSVRNGQNVTQVDLS